MRYEIAFEWSHAMLDLCSKKPWHSSSVHISWCAWRQQREKTNNETMENQCTTIWNAFGNPNAFKTFLPYWGFWPWRSIRHFGQAVPRPATMNWHAFDDSAPQMLKACIGTKTHITRMPRPIRKPASASAPAITVASIAGSECRQSTKYNLLSKLRHT